MRRTKRGLNGLNARPKTIDALERALGPVLVVSFSENLFPTPPNIRVDDRSIRAETTLQQQQHRSKKLRARNCPRIDIARRSSYLSESVIARGCSFSKQNSGSNALSVMRSRVF